MNLHKKRGIVLISLMLVIFGCVGRQPSILGTRSPEQYIDSHFHISNYAMQGVPLKTLIDRYMGEKVLRTTVLPIPLQQTWDPYEHYADDRIAPNYYLGPKAGLYYYSFIDALLALEYQKLSPEDQARIDPMIAGFNPMDRYAVQHIKRALLSFPGIFTGIGEFSIHKEIVSCKIAGDPIQASGQDPAPADTHDGDQCTLYSPALANILGFAAESGLIVILHNDLYKSRISYDGSHAEVFYSQDYREGLKYQCRSNPETGVIWAHTGLGRYIKPRPEHLEIVSEILDACPNWNIDISWDIVQKNIVSPNAGMPSFEAWVDFIRKYQDRVLWGSDTVIFTKNKIDDKGRVQLGKPMPVEDYRAVVELTRPLWNALGPEVSRKVKITNHIRLFDAAIKKIRAWEQAHAGDNVWNLSPE